MGIAQPLCIIMRNIQVLIIFLFFNGISAQNLTEINLDLKLSDSLIYETEIRIYQGEGITNYSSLFRMFKDKSGKWIVKFYEHYAEVDGIAELRIEKRTLESENDMEFIFQNLIRSHILDLPNQNEIDWKLTTRGNVEKQERIQRGKTIEEYDFKNETILITDGEGFKVQAKAFNKFNEFEYSNPDSYLRHYPKIDELIYMNEILNILRTEFHIWEN